MKQFITAIKIFSAVAIAGVSLVSCLKDENLGIKSFEGGEWVTIPLAKNASNALGLEAKNELQTLDLFNVTYDYVNTAAADIPVTIEKADAAVTAVDPTWVVVPSSNMEIPATSVTIAKGARVSNSFQVKINTGTLNPNKTYGIAFTIKGAGKAGVGVSSNLRTVVFKITIRNKYDGVYTVKGAALRAGDAVLSGPVGPIERTLATTGVNSVQWTGTVPWANGGNSTLPAGYEPNLTVNADNSITLAPAPGGAAITPNPNYVQKYDPATKTFYISFTWGAGPAARLHTDTLTFLKKRP